MPEAIRGDIWESTTSTPRWRQKLRSGEWLTQADVGTVRWTLVDQADPAVTIAKQVAVPQNVVYDVLQTGPEWAEDATGYNCAVTIPGTYLSRGGTTYKLSIVLEIFGLEENELPYEEDPVVFLLKTKPR